MAFVMNTWGAVEGWDEKKESKQDERGHRCGAPRISGVRDGDGINGAEG